MRLRFAPTCLKKHTLGSNRHLARGRLFTIHNQKLLIKSAKTEDDLFVIGKLFEANAASLLVYLADQDFAADLSGLPDR